ncbi:MAG TPA: cysteine desulfurase family protein [Bryobacterales bacterium]|nr:cysteine desulfurase family protein [Bryobacterales bacterium]
MKRQYFDHNATTPVAPEVVRALLPYLENNYGNASSIHTFGQDARSGVEQARRQVAALLNAKPAEIVFTSGGTEADNLAVLGVVRASAKPRKHLVTTTIEHPAVLAACRHLEDEGVDVSYISAGSKGVVAVEDVRAAIRPETVLITVMHANNELGTVQPIQQIARLAREAGIPFHTDGVQSAGKLTTDVQELGVDLFALGGHKIYAPKGVGALYVRKGTVLEPVAFGGRHERGRRPGTENVPGIVGLGKAAELARANLASESARLAALRDRLERGILERIEHVTVNGGGRERTPNTTNIRFDSIEGEAMVIALDLKGVAVSSGAACSSGAVEPSHVLTAIGLSADQARSSIRFSLGKQNTEADVEALIEALAGVVGHLRKLSPAYAG